MNHLNLSIRSTLLTIICILNLCIATPVGFTLHASWVEYREAQALRQAALVTNILYNLEKDLSQERGSSVPVLYTAEETMKALQEEITANRTEADKHLQQATAMLDPNNRAIMLALQKVEASYAALRETRRKLDLALAQKETPTDLPDEMFDVSTTLIMDIKALIEDYTRALMPLDAIATQHMRFKYFIWSITEFAGEEYALIGKAIVENEHPRGARLERLLSLRGRVQLGWDIASQVASSSGLYEKISPQIQEAETHYFLAFDQIKEMFYAEQVEPNASYPLSIEVWLELSSQAVDSLLALKDSSFAVTQAYVEQMEQDAKMAIAVNISLFLGSLLLSLYSWHVITGRVINPVNRMVNALYRATHNQPYDLPDLMTQSDEIGKLSQVLKIFQENAQRIAETSKELEEQRNFLKTVLSTIMEGIITIDSEGRIQMANPATEKMFGYTLDELVGQKVNMLMPDPNGQQDDSYLKHYFYIGEEPGIGKGRELEARKKDGRFFPVELSITQMVAGGQLFFVGMIHDISLRKQAEEEREHYLRDLENSNRELDDFAYIASHDLKEPLRGLQSFSKFLLEDYGDKLDTDGKSKLETISDLTQRMESLLNTLLHYSRLGRTALAVRETDLNEIVQNVIGMFAITLKEKNIEVVIPRKLPMVICDHIRIAEVFQNLIGNAMKYNDGPSNRIEIGYVEDHPKKPGERVFFVRDHGIGIAPEHMEAIFKIFKRLHARTAYGGGTGSGLTIAKKIINQHGGDIWAESEGEGKGTTFYFTIPSQLMRA